MDSGFDTEACKSYVNAQFEDSVYPSLCKYIEIPNLSRNYDEKWDTNGLLEEAANHIKTWVQGCGITGLKTEIVHHKEQGYGPIVFT